MAESERPPPETLDFLFDHLGGSLETQLATADSLDSKIFQLFSAGSVLIGLVAVGQPEHPWLLVCALIGYAGVAAAVIVAVWPRKWRVIRHADKIWPEFWDLDPRAIKHALLQQASDGYAKNSAFLRIKGRCLRFAVAALVAEAAFVGAAVLRSAF